MFLINVNSVLKTTKQHSVNNELGTLFSSIYLPLHHESLPGFKYLSVVLISVIKIIVTY